MGKIRTNELQNFFEERDNRARELLEIFTDKNEDENSLLISGYRTRAVKEANDEMLVQLLNKLDLLENE
ncbi:hypothetical protein ACSR1V_06560 [Staphylococcus haemolyticus]|uniref:hypothetical protein n=1 Tax=Staphylococcus haemolyticus TaxID=1283 RepID=UPI003EE79A58